MVASRKLNTDQKAQIEKKPGIKDQLAKLEDQLTQYRAFSSDLEERFSREKATLIESHEAEIASLKEDAAATTKASDSTNLEDALKVMSYFLHTAAAKRQSEDPDSDEARAFEGALLLVYQGNESALSTLRSLITGADEKITDTTGDLVEFTYAQIKEAALAAPKPAAEVDADAPPAFGAAGSDPTIVNAGLTELQDTNTIPLHTQNGDSEAQTIPEQTSTGDEAANAVAESKWDPAASAHTDVSAGGEDWVNVNVPRDPAETDNGLQATPADATTATQGNYTSELTSDEIPATVTAASASWAEEVSAAPVVTENDGFQEVKGRHLEQRGRGRGRGYQNGGYRGRAGGPGGRGGQRGEFRGGRGGRGGEGRGGRGANRGADRG